MSSLIMTGAASELSLASSEWELDVDSYLESCTMHSIHY